MIMLVTAGVLVLTGVVMIAMSATVLYMYPKYDWVFFVGCGLLASGAVLNALNILLT